MSGDLSLPVMLATGILPGLGARRAPGPAWHPSDFFPLSQPGIFLDGSDNSVMWQDAAGTTPVTALGQPVGLVLDKRLWGGKTFAQVMAEQPELVSNPGAPFSATTGWVGGLGTTVSVVDGRLRIIGTSSSGVYVKARISLGVLTAGKTYRVVGTNVQRMTGNAIRAVINTTGDTSTASQPAIPGSGYLWSVNSNANANYEVNFTATSTAEYFLWAFGQDFTGDVDLRYGGLSVREIPGNHARQETSASRPIWQEDDFGARGLQFDGSNDFLVTQNIDFSASDKMLASAGVRKLSDAALGMVAELSASSAANNGAFQLVAPRSTSLGAGFGSRGSAYQEATIGGDFVAPSSAVLTGLGDIGSDICRLRVNGTQVAQNTSDQGAGNYGNYPLYVGRRDGSSFPFNGFIHQLVVRGGALPDADELAQLETFIAQKSKVAA